MFVLEEPQVRKKTDCCGLAHLIYYLEIVLAKEFKRILLVFWFTGVNCEINLDDCKSNPCDYGKCIDKINGYECACEPGYTGQLLFEIHPDHLLAVR